MECKKALEEADGDTEEARKILQKKSGAKAGKKADRSLGAGTIAAYIHAGGTVGAMVELSCETDFVARNDEFKQLAYDIAMHVAAMDPQFVSEEDITEKDREEMKAHFREEVEGMDKPEEVKNTVLENKTNIYFEERTLTKQAFVKDADKTINDLLDEAVQKFGERTQVTNIARLAI